MFQQALLTDQDTERIRDVALAALEQAGMVFQSERFLRALERRGARVDWPGERARIPRSLVLPIIEAEAKANPQPPATGSAPLPSLGLPMVGTQVAQLFYDQQMGKGRAPHRDDFIRQIRFGDALHGDRGVGHVLIRHDVPPPVEPLEAQALLLEYAHKPHSAYFFYAEQLDYAAEIGEIYCGDRRRFSGGGVFLTSPLRLCRRACNLMTKRLDMGFSASAGTMPVVGASVPVTLAGAIAVTAAEILGVWAGYRALAEAVPLGAGIAAGAVDMKTANVSFCSPAAMLLNVGVAEFFRRLCGKAIGIAGAGDYCDGKNPGLRTALEKAHKTMTVAAFTGRHGAVGEGMLDSGKVFSPEQLLIERDLSESLQWLFRPVTVNPETLAEEAILEIGPGLQQAHLTSEHTLAHFRQALRSPRFHDLAPLVDYRPDYDRERRAVAEAHELYLETVARYQPPVVDTDKLRAIHQVVDRARQASGAWDLG